MGYLFENVQQNFHSSAKFIPNGKYKARLFLNSNTKCLLTVSVDLNLVFICNLLLILNAIDCERKL